MEVITKVLDELIDIPPNHFVFDIETTGLNSNYCKVILIGILFNQDNKTVIKQYFANTEDDEKELLLSFINDIKNPYLITTLIFAEFSINLQSYQYYCISGFSRFYKI